MYPGNLQRIPLRNNWNAKTYMLQRKSLGMKNYFSKSSLDNTDFQKFFNLILTEQRAQRVDLARIYHQIKDLITSLELPGSIPEEQEEQPDVSEQSNKDRI